MDRGSVFRRCGCRDQATGRLLGARCPGLNSRRHGTWYFSTELPSSAGDRRRVRRGGFTSRAAAVAALEALSGPAPGPVQGLRVGEWLERWLASRVSLRASTSRGYAAHVRGYLVPYLGGILLAELTAADVQGMFTAIIRVEAALGRPVSAATLRRIHATLRAPLNAAVRAGLIAVNPGRWPELPPGGQAAAAGVDRGDDPAVGAGGLAASGGRVDGGADRPVPAAGARAPAVCTVPSGRAARPAAWRGRRTQVERPGPGRRDADGDRAAAAAGRAAGGRAAEERGGVAGGRAGPVHDRGAARPPRPPAGRAYRRGRRVGRDRVCVHHPGREAGRAGPADPAVPPPGRRIRAAAGHTARPAARRGHPLPGWPPGTT
jgi:hypothetical protein